MKSITTAAALATVALVGGCVAPMAYEWQQSVPAEHRFPNGSQATGPRSEVDTAPGLFQERGQYPLYSRDGGVVDSRKPGSVTEDTPSHDVDKAAPGRMYILELYQAAIDERDALQLEVAALNRALERTKNDLAATTAAFDARGEELARSERQRSRLQAENEDLTARLVTAQIRRLEAEKVLIESRLEWYRGLPPTPSQKAKRPDAENALRQPATTGATDAADASPPAPPKTNAEAGPEAPAKVPATGPPVEGDPR